MKNRSLFLVLFLLFIANSCGSKTDGPRFYEQSEHEENIRRIERVIGYMDEKKPALAIAELDKIIAERPELGFPYVLRAKCNAQLKNFPMVCSDIASYQAIIKSDPKKKVAEVFRQASLLQKEHCFRPKYTVSPGKPTK